MHGLPGHFRDHGQCRSCGLSSASVTSVGVVPWHRALRLCCANPTARAISDMAVGPNPDSNPGLSDLRRPTNNIELSAKGSSLNKWRAGRPLPSGKVVPAVVMPPQAHRELQGKQNKTKQNKKQHRTRTRSRRGIEPGLRESESRIFFPKNSSQDRTQVAPIKMCPGSPLPTPEKD